MKRLVICLSAGFLLSGSLPAFSQQKSQPAGPAQEEAVKISAELVQLDAVVTDRSGNYVTNLTKDDFKVEEDGDRQEVTHFQYIDLSQRYRETVQGNPVPDLNKGLTAGDVRRVFAFVIDDLHISAIDLVRVRQMLTDFVDNKMAPGDLAAIVRTGRGGGLYDQFTSDQTMLKRIISEIRLPSQFSFGEANSGVSGTNVDNAGEEIPDVNAVAGEDTEDEVYQRNVSAVSAINFVIKGLQDLPGRKSLVLVSPGYVGRANPFDLNRLLTATIDTALRAGVVIYAIDIRGLQYTGPKAESGALRIAPTGSGTVDGPGEAESFSTEFTVVSRREHFTPSVAQRGGGGGGRPAPSRPSPPARAPRSGGDFDRALFVDPRLAELNQTSTLRYLSNETGGFAVVNNNDFKIGMDRIINDTKGYYVIAYSPKNRNFDGKFRKIEVQVPKGLIVHTRGGYYANPDKGRSADSPEHEEIMKLMRSPLVKQEIGLNAAIYKTYVPKQGASVLLQLHIDASKLSLEKKGGMYEDQLQVAGYIFNASGKLATSFSNGLDLRLSEAERAQALEDGFSSVTQGTIAPGAYQLRAVVREPRTGAVGTISQYFEIPRVDNKRFALSSLFVRKEAEAGSSDASSIKRRLHRSDPLLYRLVVYNATVDKNTRAPSLTSQLVIYQNHKIVFQGSVDSVKTGQGDTNQIVIGSALRLGDFQPGTYIVQVRVTDQLAKKGANVLASSREIELVK